MLGVFRPKAPNRGLLVPWTGSLWHKRAGVATWWSRITAVLHFANQDYSPQHGRVRAPCNQDGPARSWHHWLPWSQPGWTRWQPHHVQVPGGGPRGLPLLPLLSIIQHSHLHGEKQSASQSSHDSGIDISPQPTYTVYVQYTLTYNTYIVKPHILTP